MSDLKIEYDSISYDCTDAQKPSVHEVIIADLLYNVKLLNILVKKWSSVEYMALRRPISLSTPQNLTVKFRRKRLPRKC